MTCTLYERLASNAFDEFPRARRDEAAALLRQVAARLREAARRREHEQYGSAWMEVWAAIALLRLAGVPKAEQ